MKNKLIPIVSLLIGLGMASSASALLITPTSDFLIDTRISIRLTELASQRQKYINRMLGVLNLGV